MTKKQRSLIRRRHHLTVFLADVIPNNLSNPGWNRAEDLGVPPERQPTGKLVRWASSFKAGKDSGRMIVYPVVIWRY